MYHCQMDGERSLWNDSKLCRGRKAERKFEGKRIDCTRRSRKLFSDSFYSAYATDLPKKAICIQHEKNTTGIIISPSPSLFSLLSSLFLSFSLSLYLSFF